MRESWEKNKKETFGKKRENKIRMKVYRKKKETILLKGSRFEYVECLVKLKKRNIKSKSKHKTIKS